MRENRRRTRLLELSVVAGLEPFAADEITHLPGTVRAVEQQREGRLLLRYSASLRDLHALQTVSSVHEILQFEGARPSTLLGHANLTRIIKTAQAIFADNPGDVFETMRLSAAGSSTPLMQRLKAEIAAALSLRLTDEPAHLELALRRAQPAGWELLIRTTPRPLSARDWRVCDYPGALNATVANVMARLANLRADDVVVNLCAGSGTLLAERWRLQPPRMAIGIDNSTAALACARQNLAAAGAGCRLILGDATRTPLPDAIASTVVMDPPFGMLQSGAGEPGAFYGSLVDEAARILKPNGHFVVISTRKQLVRNVLARSTALQPERVINLKLPYDRGYLTPAIFVLRRQPS